MDLFTYLMAKNGQNTHRDLFSYLLGKKASGGSGTYTTFSGTSLNISNTIKAAIKKFMLNSTELTQDGTPTPDNPVDVNVITGDNKVKIENKNLAYTGWAEDFVNRINDAAQAELLTYDNKNCLKFRNDAGSGDYDNKYILKINWKENTQYTFVFDLLSVSGYFNFSIDYTDGTTSYINGTQSVNQWRKVIWTTDTNKTVRRLRARNVTGLSYVDLDTFMVLEGVYTAETIPEYVEHQEQNYPITLSSENLLNLPTKLVEVTKNGLTFTPVYIGDALLYINVNGTATADTEYYIIDTTHRLTLPAGSYLFSSGVDGSNSTYFVNFSARNLSTISNYSGNTSLTINSSDNFWFLIKVRNGITVDNVKFKPFMRVSTSTSEYTPYIANPIEYCKIGDYADQIFKNTTDSEFYDSTLLENEWYLKKNINKVLLNGSENWLVENNLAYITINDALGKSSKTYINYFKSVTTITDVWGDAKFGTSNSNLIFYKAISENTDLEGWKNWLSTHNTKVYYILETPQYIHISETDYSILKSQLENLYNNAKSYNGQTNITQTNDGLPFNISVDVKVS